MATAWNQTPSIRNEALMVALTDYANHCEEGVRRHKAELKMRREWAERQPEDAELRL